MRTIETTATLTDDRTLMVSVPVDLEPGQHRVVVVVDEQPIPTGQPRPLELPVHDLGPWPEGLTLRREDLYDDWGR